ncbi:MAG: Asp-tRNA(Asn)/Glu-tRNA(Gln) amidotransferase GatCAB subunit A [Deltaproteobacteria bacterium]|nr:Asp-tRNA(Asn)/Glu-tRNA(Gln) amidotransferase GatCAB subunit A [Deltaproteobacteria bacterium]
MDTPQTLDEMAAALRSGQCSAAQLIDQALGRAQEHRHLNAFLSLDPEGAQQAAAKADEELASGHDRGPLHGVPVAIKDNICTQGMPTTCASQFLDNFAPPYDATAVQRLRDAGAVIIGKTNLDEFAMGSSNENSSYGPVLNPLDTSRVPGGSSGGSAAAVAAGIVPLSLGSDTGGSVRQPAALCGVVGVKPTYGRVSRNGLVAFGSSLDQIGPFATTVKGAAGVLQAIAGGDPMDATCPDQPMDNWAAECEKPVGPIRVGLPVEYTADLTDEARAALLGPLEAMDDVELVEVALPHTRFAIAAYYVLASAEASANLARFDGIRYGVRVAEPESDLQDVYVASRTAGFGPEVKRRIMLGTFALSAGYYEAYYGKAQQARAAIGSDFDKAFEQVDVIASLTSPTTAFELDARTQDPLEMYLSDIFTVPSSLAGLPAISVPAGADGKGLPWGIQVIAPHWEEGSMFQFATRIESHVASAGSLP